MGMTLLRINGRTVESIREFMGAVRGGEKTKECDTLILHLHHACPAAEMAPARSSQHHFYKDRENVREEQQRRGLLRRASQWHCMPTQQCGQGMFRGGLGHAG